MQWYRREVCRTRSARGRITNRIAFASNRIAEERRMCGAVKKKKKEGLGLCSPLPLIAKLRERRASGPSSFFSPSLPLKNARPRGNSSVQIACLSRMPRREVSSQRFIHVLTSKNRGNLTQRRLHEWFFRLRFRFVFVDLKIDSVLRF